MGKVNVYLPDDLERAVKDAGIPLSSVCQVALRSAVDRVDALRGAADPVAALGPTTPRLADALGHVPGDPTRDDGLAGPLELLAAIVLHGDNVGARVLRDLGVELPRPSSRRRSARTAKGFTDEARAVLADAVRVALELRRERVGTEHLVLALTVHPATAELFHALGVDERNVRSRIERVAEERTAEVPAPNELFDRFEAELRRLGDELRQLRGD
jgi:ATP-dependent Clp protease ATP-binding subunit ClpC